MTRYKKDIPLVVLQTIEPLITESSKLFKIIDTAENLLYIEDADPQSNFYFKIISYSEQGQNIAIEFKPMNQNNVDTYGNTIGLQGLKGLFVNWKSYLQAYENIKIFDDPILRQYQLEFENEIHIIDEDADYNTYDISTQIWLDQYLTRYQERLELFKTSENKNEIEEIQIELAELKTTQTKLTKNKIINRLSKIWAKTRKIGLGLLNDVFQEVKSEIINRLITGRLDDFTKFL